MSLIEKLEAASRELDLKERDSLVDIARAIARGDVFDEHEAAKLLRNAGQTPADLKSLVDRVKDRIHLRALLDQKSVKSAELEELKKVIEAKNAEFQTARDAYDAEIRPLLEKREQLQADWDAGHHAEKRLHNCVVDQSLLRRKEELQNRRLGPAQMLRNLDRSLLVTDDGSPAYSHACAVEAVKHLRNVVAAKEVDGTEETLRIAVDNLKVAESDLQSKAEVISRLKAKRAEVVAELKALEAEGEALRAEELEP